MITQTDRIKISEEFKELTTLDDLASFLNTSKKQLIYYSLILPENKKYKSFTIPKKSGSFREISSPCITLKYIQKQLAEKLQVLYNPSSVAHGFIKTYQDGNDKVVTPSIVSNASVHVRKKNILNLDIKDFFPTITKKRVYGLFRNQYSIDSKIAHYLSLICCAENGLPQGAPTSPIITNMICSRLDRKLKTLAAKNYMTFSRYADDLSFSTSKQNIPDDFEENVLRIIQEEGFKPNEKKRRLLIRENRLEVTGLTVNQKTNVQRRYVRNIRAIFHSIDKKGLHTSLQNYCKLKGINKRQDINILRSYIKGKVEFLGQVKGKEDPIYIKYLKKYTEVFKVIDIGINYMTKESVDFIDNRNELLLKLNSEIVNSIKGETEIQLNIRNRIRQKLDKARKVLLSPEKNNYLETIYLIWFSCLNEFQKIHFKETKEKKNGITTQKVFLNDLEIDFAKYSKNFLNIPDSKNISFIQKKEPIKDWDKIKEFTRQSVLIQIFLYENKLENSLFNFVWLNEIRNRLNLTHSDDNHLRKSSYTERVSWQECSWLFQFIYLIFVQKHIERDQVFSNNPYINSNLLANNMIISGRVKNIVKNFDRTNIVILFSNTDSVDEHEINCIIWSKAIAKNQSDNDRLKNLNETFLSQKIDKGDFVKVDVTFNVNQNPDTGVLLNNIYVKNIEKLERPNFQK